MILPVPLEAGARLAETYRIDRKLGQGGMGAVFLARHERWGLDVALKVPHPFILADADHSRRIVREAEAWTDLGLHPHIAYCYYVHRLDSALLLVVEYLDGGNLRQWIEDMRCAELRTALDLAIQFCHGLEHAHGRGLVHRDIKPENLLLTSDAVLKITDFGIAGGAGQERAPAGPAAAGQGGLTVGAIGTYDYMPPEQFCDAHRVDGRADIFSFGVCFYEMLCGARPYALAAGPRQDAPSPGKLRGEALPARLESLMRGAVDWDRDRRPPSAASLKEELAGIHRELFGAPSPWEELPPVSLEADGWNNRAVSLLELGRVEDARQCLAAALAANPAHLESVRNAALLDWQSGVIDDLQALNRLDRISTAAGIPKKELAAARAGFHIRRADPEAAGKQLERWPGAFETSFGPGPHPRHCRLRLIRGHRGSVHASAMTPDGARLLTGGEDTSVRLWDTESGECLHLFQGHAKPVRSVVLLGAGIAATAGHEPLIRLWDLASGKPAGTLEAPAAAAGKPAVVSALAATPDGRLLLAGAGHGDCDVWEPAGRRHLARLAIGLSGLGANPLAVSPDGAWCLSAGYGGVLNIWNLAGGVLRARLSGHTADIRSIALAAGRSLALTGAEDGKAKLWDLDSGELLRTLQAGSTHVGGVAPNAGGEFGVTACGPALRLWHLSGGECLATPRAHGNSIWTVSASADGRRAFLGTWDGGEIWEFSWPGGRRPSYLPCRPKRFVEVRREQETRQAAWRQAELDLAAGRTAEAHDRLMRCWETVGYGPEETAERLYGRLCALGKAHLPVAVRPEFTAGAPGRGAVPVALAPAANRAVAIVPQDRALLVFDLAAGKLVRTIDTKCGPTRLAVTPDARRALVAALGQLKLYDLETGAELCLIRGDDRRPVTALAISPDGNRALTGYEHLVLLRDLGSGDEREVLSAPQGARAAVAATPDWRLALIGSRDKLALVDLETLRQPVSLPLESARHEYVAALAISDDAAAAVVLHPAPRFWDLTTGRWRPLKEPSGSARNSAALTADGRFAFAGGFQNIQAWDTGSGEPVWTAPAGGTVWSLAVAPHGAWVASGEHEGIFTIWRWIWKLELGR